jgi:hypothetical protein
MKEKMRLTTALKIKDYLEENIKSYYNDIVNYNDSKDISVEELLSKVEKLEAQQIIIKEVIQDANRRRHIRSIHTNNYYIYKNSNLVAKKRFYNTLRRKLTCVQIDKDRIRTEIKKIDGELEIIRNKLSNFNSRRKVTVEIDESLNLPLDK